jgi:hypothetical protein
MNSPDESNPLLRGRIGRGVLIAAGLLIAMMAVNWVLAVARFQVNGLFSDQWNFCEPILRGEGPLALFTWQHGPHRQGLAFVFTSWIWQLSGWDTRIEALWGAGWLVVVAGLMLGWKYRLSGRLSWWDLWIPFAALALRQFETIITTPNLSHSVFPLVLLLVTAGGLARPMRWWTWLGVGLVGVVAIFTGFGIFVGAGLGWVIVLQLGRMKRMSVWRGGIGVALGAGVLVAGLGWFLMGYELNAASSGATFPHWPLGDYPKFVVVMLASRMDLTGGTAIASWAGSVMLAVSVGVFCHASWRVSRDAQPAPAMATAAMLLAAGLGYAFFTAAGRVHLGVVAGEAPRYTSLMVSFWLGIVAWSCTRPGVLWRVGAAMLGWAMVIAPWVDLKDRELRDWPGSVGMSYATRVAIELSNYQKIEWLSIWEETGDWRLAEAAVPEAIHGQAAAVQMGDKIEFMRAHRLSFASRPEMPRSWLPWWNPKGVTWVRALGGVSQQWMAEEAILFIDGRDEGFLNLRLAWKAEVMPEDALVAIEMGDHVARMSYRELWDGVSIPAAVDRQKLVLRSLSGVVPLDPPGDLRLGSFLVVEPSLTAEPAYAERDWVEDAEGLWPPESFVVRAGFYGWEDGGAFGWSDARLEVAARSVTASYLNVAIESRFAAVDAGPIHVYLDGARYVLPWSAEGLRFSVELATGRSHEFVLENVAGARSPADTGESGDARKLALRISQLSLDQEASFPVINRVGSP